MIRIEVEEWDNDILRNWHKLYARHDYVEALDRGHFKPVRI